MHSKPSDLLHKEISGIFSVISLTVTTVFLVFDSSESVLSIQTHIRLIS
jgi:hypothetical protein